MKVRPVLFESVDFAERVTEMYDFVWPTATAMWNLRRRVQRFMRAYPNATKNDLHCRFVEGSGIRGENLERACIKHEWEHQQRYFANIILVNLFAHYESWCNAICNRFDAPQDIEKDLQFWVRIKNEKKRRITRRFDDAVRLLAAQPSATMATAFGTVYQRSKRYAGTDLEAMLNCLRFFKESRNVVAHQGAKASERLVEAYRKWLPFASAARLGVKEVPRHSAPILGQPCSLDLRGVVGFGHVLLRIVETVDADLAGTKQAEEALIERWRERVGTLKVRPSKAKARDQVLAAIGRIGMLRPLVTDDLLAMLRANRLVT